MGVSWENYIIGVIYFGEVYFFCMDSIMIIEKFSNLFVVRLWKFFKIDFRKVKYKEWDVYKVKSRVFVEGKIGRMNLRVEERDDFVMFVCIVFVFF